MSSPANWLAWRYLADEWVECDSVSIADRGFRYGMSVFETIAVRAGRPLFVKQHLKRLLRAVKTLEWETPQFWEESLQRLFADTSFKDGVVRIFVTAGEGSPVDHPHEHGFYALWEDVPFPDKAALEKGLCICSIREFSRTGFSGMKTGNYWGHVHALQESRKRKADECLIFDARGVLVSAAMANVFLCLDGAWHTPPLEVGARDGVVREWLLKHAGGRERHIHEGDLQSVEEIVLVNSRIGVMPVRRYDEKDLPQMRRGRELASAYLREIAHA